jgi:hypothetical protein
MTGAVVALALLGLFHNGDATEHRDVRVQHAHVAGWRLEVRGDRFTGQTTCALRRDDIVYDHGVVTFALGHRVDTANATYRLDDGPVRRAGDVAVEAAGLGARFDSQNLDNPSNGEVRIPAKDLGDARKIYIRANTKMTHRIFDLAGLPRALEAAKARNCDTP